MGTRKVVICLRRLLPRRAWVWTAVMGLAWSAAGVPGKAQRPVLSVQEYQLKAAFLYNFAKFVEWPTPAAGSRSPLVIVVFGRDPMGPALDQAVWGKTLNGRPFVVRHTNRVREVLPCHVLFVGADEVRRVREALQSVEGTGVLTMGESEDFLESGGTVRFVVENNKVRFVINLEAARRSGVRISSKLLSLAQVIRN
jgi:hypothetical protein